MKPKPTAGKDLAAFRAAHDKSFIIPQKIRLGLGALGDGWEYEADFIKRCGVCNADFGAFRDEFAEFFVETRATGKTPKRVWAGTKAFATKLRETVT
jgi:hypothetical protein